MLENGLQIKEKLVESFNNTEISNYTVPNNISIKVNFVCNPFVEISGNSDDIFHVELIEKEKVIHTSNIRCNMWTKAFRAYYTDWRVRITNTVTSDIVYDRKIDLEGKRVYICLESKSLGDTLAWFPYAEEFRKKHKCHVIISTFLNSLFVEQYPNLEFIEPGQPVQNIFAQYRVGWFYKDGMFDSNLNPMDFKKWPLQKTASDILGLDYKEVRPKLKLNKNKIPKKVGIGFHSTTQAKYWNNPDGWQKVVDYLISKGYECIIYSKEENGYMGNYFPKGVSKFRGRSLSEVIEDLSTCEFFIGLGSGLSWLAWACELPVVLISGFSKKWAETSLNTYRVINETKCNGCFNTEKLDPSDWNWCPFHKGTERQFECSKDITADSVISEIDKIITGKLPDEIKLEEDQYEIPGWFSYSQIYDLFVKEADNDSTIVEIGSWFGKSTKYLLEKVEKSGKKINVEVIDTFKGSLNEDFHQQVVGEHDNDIYQHFYQNIEHNQNIVVHKNYSQDSAELFPTNSIDFLMIDGDHSYEGVTSDINNYFHKVKPGGIISGDDYNVFDGTTLAVNDFFLGAHQLYKNNFNWLYRKPKIQIIHVSTIPLQDRAKKSIKNFELLKRYGFDLRFIQNEPYRGQIDITKYANPSNPNLRPTHYGCYLGHTQALTEIDDINYDFTLILEEDAYIYTSVKEFIDILYKAIFACQTDKSLAYISFGSDVWMPKQHYNKYFDECYHQILAHCYLVPNSQKGWYMDKINTGIWDSADLWYNLIFQSGERKRLVTKEKYSKQINGFSIIDDVYKDYVNNNY